MRSIEVAPRGRRPPIRLRPIPACDPPFDDEVSPQVWASVHQLAFDLHGLAGNGPHGTHPDSNGPDSTGPDSTGPDSTGPDSIAAGRWHGGAVAGASAEARQAVRRFVAICVEVLNGYRPAAHLRRLSLPREAAGVVTEALTAARRVAELRRASGRSPRSASRHGRRPDPVAVRRLRLCEPRPGAVEAVVLLVTAERTWALAVRLERHQQSWLTAVLRLV